MTTDLTLVAELESIAAAHPAAWPLVRQLRQANPDFDSRAGLVVAASSAAGLGVYRSAALLLKLLAAERASNPLRLDMPSYPASWQYQLERLRAPLGAAAASLSPAEFELLVIEQHALACDTLEAPQLATLALRHDQERALLAAAAGAERAAFMDDKRGWLLDEIQLDELHGVRQRLVEELESTRMQYLALAGRDVVDLVEAAHRVALLRYRVALDDPTLTPEELNLRLQSDLSSADDAGALVRLEPELRRALLNSEPGTQADYGLLLHLCRLRDGGCLQPASAEEQQQAAIEFRRLARLIHPDALAHHPQYHDIAPRNERRLREIWQLASATHGVRVQLSRDKLLDFLSHLRRWKEEVLRILRDIAFPTPSLLLQGEPLDARHADLRRAIDDVGRHLHAVRDDIAALEFDPLHDEYRRVIAMSDEQMSAERERMAALTAAWNAEARDLAAQLAARSDGAAAGGRGQP